MLASCCIIKMAKESLKLVPLLYIIIYDKIHSIFMRKILKEHEPEIWWKIEKKLRTRLSLKPCRKIYAWKTMQKLFINKWT